VRGSVFDGERPGDVRYLAMKTQWGEKGKGRMSLE